MPTDPMTVTVLALGLATFALGLVLLLAALRHVAVVGYDAFGDVGGRLSFSAAPVHG